MNPVIKALIFLTLVPSMLWAMDMQRLYEESRFWPRRVSIVEPITLPTGKTIHPPHKAIFVRLESGDGDVLLDFGKDGVYSVSADKTDLLEIASLFESGDRLKKFPNMLDILANKLIVYDGEAFKQSSITDFQVSDRWLFLYPASREQVLNLALEYGSTQDRFKEIGLIPVLMPSFPYKDADLADDMASQGAPLPLMMSYLTPGYRTAFAHPVDESGSAVYSDPDGKILGTFKLDSLKELILRCE